MTVFSRERQLLICCFLAIFQFGSIIFVLLSLLLLLSPLPQLLLLDVVAALLFDSTKVPVRLSTPDFRTSTRSTGILPEQCRCTAMVIAAFAWSWSQERADKNIEKSHRAMKSIIDSVIRYFPGILLIGTNTGQRAPIKSDGTIRIDDWMHPGMMQVVAIRWGQFCDVWLVLSIPAFVFYGLG